ncbi:MAG: hypothetical protein H6822_25200 [Planctomycetaceae bacterium]|nr:hypothetical protein [Planctomycetales bacterium]MCB9925473.1 hypothetical protein [Planctomycetaceae bacterium]
MASIVAYETGGYWFEPSWVYFSKPFYLVAGARSCVTAVWFANPFFIRRRDIKQGKRSLG